MADTARTIADLKALFRDGQPKRSITPDRVRDLIATVDARTAVSVKEYGATLDNSRDDGAALAAAVAAAPAGGTIVIPPGTAYLANGLTISGKTNLTVLCQGSVRCLSDITFEDCDGLNLIGRFTGNSLVTATVVSASALTGSTSSIVLDDASGFAVNDSIQVYRVTPFNARVYRGTVTSVAGNTLTLTDDTGIGGSIADAAAGMLCVAIVSGSLSRVVINDSDGITVSGYYEKSLVLHNCTNFTVPEVRCNVGEFRLEFCYNGSIGSVSVKRAPFYGFGAFKSRKFTVGQVTVDKAYFGGAVFKNNYDFSVGEMNIRQGMTYGVQIRDDTGTVPSTINPDLQSTLTDTYRGTFGSINLLECQRGIWFDNESHDMLVSRLVVDSTLTEASLHLSDDAKRIVINSAIITNHNPSGLMGDFRANAPIRLEDARDVQLNNFKFYNCLHPSLLVAADPPSTNVTMADWLIDSCQGYIDLNGVSQMTVRDVQLRDPAADIAYVVWPHAACDGILIDGLKVSNAGAHAITSGVRIEHVSTAHPSNVEVRNCNIISGPTFADIFVDSDGSDIWIHGNRCISSATNGITVRGAVSPVRVNGNCVRNHTNNYHTLIFTGADYSIEDLPLFGSATWDPASVATGGTTSTTLTVTGASLGDVVTVSFSVGLGGLILWGEVSTSNTVKAWLYNPTAGAIDLASGSLRAVVRKFRVA